MTRHLCCLVWALAGRDVVVVCAHCGRTSSTFPAGHGAAARVAASQAAHDHLCPSSPPIGRTPRHD